jgi:hypothetical protein
MVFTVGMTTKTAPRDIKDDDAVMVNDCLVCGDMIKHGEGHSELISHDHLGRALPYFTFHAIHFACDHLR